MNLDPDPANLVNPDPDPGLINGLKINLILILIKKFWPDLFLP